MAGGIDTTIFAAFAVGALSFFSPCVLPLVPGYLSAISGASPLGADGETNGRRLLWPAVIFCLAFTTIFIALGLGATSLGRTLATSRGDLQRIGGVMIVLMGVLMALSIVRPRMMAGGRQWRPGRLAAAAGAGGPLIAGAAFAIAWTPCVGPTLGAILTAAGTKQDLSAGAVLLAGYSAGLSVPFIGAALGAGTLTAASDWVRRHHAALMGVSSAILVAVGVLMITNQFFYLNVQAQKLTQQLNLNF